jgi:putative transposase
MIAPLSIHSSRRRPEKKRGDVKDVLPVRAFLHHSDRGSQYTSEQFLRLMADHGVICSMSRSGNVWDNAAMESFFSSLKTERTGRKLYRTRDDAKSDVFDYIERFYNPKRRHSTISYLSPMEFEPQAGFA